MLKLPPQSIDLGDGTRSQAAVEKNDIPYQIFNNRSDSPGGGTIGPIISADYGVTSVDIGNPMLSMHAVRELAGSSDHYYMTKLFSKFFESVKF